MSLTPLSYLYWASKTEPKVYRIRMDGSQTDSQLVRHFAVLPSGYSRIPSEGVQGLSLNFTSSGALQMYWVVKVVNGGGRWVWFGVGVVWTGVGVVWAWGRCMRLRLWKWVWFG